MPKPGKRVLVSGILLLLASAAAAPAQEYSIAPALSVDQWITAAVESAFYRDAGIKTQDIVVSVANGLVTLSGTAGDAERRRAVALAQQTREVTGVIDRIVAPTGLPHPNDVAGTSGAEASLPRASDAGEAAGLPPSRQRPLSAIGAITAAESDSTIQAAIRTRLAADPVLRSAALLVDVQNGAVLMRGVVASDAAHQRARAVALSVRGVKGLVDRTTIAR